MGQIKVLEISFDALILADEKKRSNLLICAELDGIEVYCHTVHSVEYTTDHLRDLELLQYFDGINRDFGDTQDSLYICKPEDVDYRWVSKYLARSRQRITNLLTDLD